MADFLEPLLTIRSAAPDDNVERHAASRTSAKDVVREKKEGDGGERGGEGPAVREWRDVLQASTRLHLLDD